MATKPAATADTATAEQDVDTTLLDMQSAAVKRLIARGKERGYITFDELNAVLPPDQNSSEQIEDVMADAQRNGHPGRRERGKRGRRGARRQGREGRGRGRGGREPTGNVDEESLGRTDDPVRMYLREMGSVELLSREGEIAIAKRIEAGRDMMIGGLCESPLTFRAIIAWHDALKAGRMLLRDIVDLEATQGGPAPAAGGGGRGRGAEAAAERASTRPAEEMDDGEEGEGAGLSLSALEEKLKPEVLATFEEIEALYKKLHKMQTRRLETMTSGEEVSTRSEKTYEKPREELVGKVEQVRLHNNRIEELVTQLKQLNQRLNALEGQLLRMAESCKVAARRLPEELSRPRAGSELAGAGRRAARQGLEDRSSPSTSTTVADVRGADRRGRQRCRPADRRVPPRLHDGQPRRARQRARQEGDDRGQPAPGDLDRQEIHQSRAAVPGPDPGRQYRPDEGGR